MTEHPLPNALKALDRIADNAEKGIGARLTAQEVYELSLCGFLNSSQEDRQ